MEQMCPCRADWPQSPLQFMVWICPNEPRGYTLSADARAGSSGLCSRVSCSGIPVSWGLVRALLLTRNLVMLQLQFLVRGFIPLSSSVVRN